MTVNQNAQPSEATGTVDVQVMGFDGVASETQIAPTTQGVTVDKLLARKNGFMIAHRGGSADWPEMSLLAYNESANRGIPALEFSFSLTSDGVPVGVHNQNLKGVDRSAPETPVTQMTWEQVRELVVGLSWNANALTEEGKMRNQNYQYQEKFEKENDMDALREALKD